MPWKTSGKEERVREKKCISRCDAEDLGLNDRVAA